MAFFLAHPAIAVPLRPLCRRGWLHFPALVVGSIAPDIGYLLGKMEFSDMAHTPLGGLTHAMPVAIVLLALFYLVRIPVFFTIPYPFRQFLMHCPSVRIAPTDQVRLTAACLSILVGIASHLAWDSFTQTDGFLVERLSALNTPISLAGGMELPPYTMLFHVTTGLGFLVLALFAGRWLTRRLLLLRVRRGGYESWRWYFWCLILTVPAAYAIANNWGHTAGTPHYLRYKWFTQSVLVDFVAMFVTALVVASIMVWVAHQMRHEDEDSGSEGRETDRGDH